MTTQKKAEIRIVSKLTTKNVGIAPKKIVATPDEVRSLTIATVYGLADGVKVVEDPNNGSVYYPLLGRFQAVHPETGDITRSGLLYLPGGVHETYLSAVRDLEDGDVLRLALELRVVKADNPQGYSYVAVDLIPAEEVNPLDEIHALAAGNTPKSLGGNGTHKAIPAITATEVQAAHAPAAQQAKATPKQASK